MANRYCLEPRCPDYATYRGRCQRHARGRERETHGNKRFYNLKRWKLTRWHALTVEPFCRICAEQGVETLATEVDHIVPIEDGGAPFDQANLRPLCKRCHSQVTRAAQTRG